MARYCAAWAERDRQKWLDTFEPDAWQEDPVGEGRRRGREEIGGFWDRAHAAYDSLEIRPRQLHDVGDEAALEWTIVAGSAGRWTVFDGVDVFVFGPTGRIASVRAYWARGDRRVVDAYPPAGAGSLSGPE